MALFNNIRDSSLSSSLVQIMTMRIGLVIDIESDEESDEDSDQMEEEESYDWEEGVFETLTKEESYNNDKNC